MKSHSVVRLASLLFALASSLAFAQDHQTPSYFEEASKTIGKTGTLNPDGSYRINIPRTDVSFKNSRGMPIPADLGLATYAAFSGGENEAFVVGDVAMLQHEIDGVIDALRLGGIEVVALHNHMTTESPRLFYMHYQGHGRVADLAATLKNAFALLGKPAPSVEPLAAPGKPDIDWDALGQVFAGKPQKFASGVMRWSMPRKDLKIIQDQLPFTPAMGLGSWAAFNACECGLTMVMGDTCCGSRTELQTVVDALRKAGISITGIHNHVFAGSQEVLFLHFDGEGDALKMAQGIKNGWNALGSH
ncbi:MAG: DUF1259 domain-containing protein [Fimbriimonas ginsengisoli]|uniref:DUF1259 domain-containing protein n=1 Tax=Fimbriimonas ginsengisoli TaxID=1005039 RepID=A0A931LWT1_FIMGI|nr:DUF1259 domain-containing protein [Fimbriimonas ginsengisoli]